MLLTDGEGEPYPVYLSDIIRCDLRLLCKLGIFAKILIDLFREMRFTKKFQNSFTLKQKPLETKKCRPKFLSFPK